MEVFPRWAWGDEHNMEQNTSNQGFLGHGDLQISPNAFCLIWASTVIESVEMPQVSNTKFPGIIVDESLNWRDQTDCVNRKINKSIGIIRRISHLVTTNCLLTLYYSLIYPYLSYCNIVWASTSPTTLHKTLVLQKHFVRIATRSE